MDKYQIRAEIRERMKKLKADANVSAIIDHPRFKDADIVLGYISLGQEADCSKAIDWAIKHKKVVALPKVILGSSEMDFYRLNPDLPMDQQLEDGAYGIREPVEGLNQFYLDSIDLKDKKIFVIVPGVAFTKDGKRCGHGKGFYDIYIKRLAAACNNVYLCGFANTWQIFEDLPVLRHDVKMDTVIF